MQSLKRQKVVNMMSKNVAKKGEFTGRHMAIIMVAFFGVIIAVNLTMATLASRSWTGLVVKNSYVESQKFNAKLSNSRAQTALNWKGVFSQTKGGVQFELRLASGKAVVADKVVAILRRPATEVLDERIVLQPLDKGIFAGDIKLDSGAWTAEIFAEIPAETGNSQLTKPLQWRMNYNIYVKNDGSFAPVANSPKK